MTIDKKKTHPVVIRPAKSDDDYTVMYDFTRQLAIHEKREAAIEEVFKSTMEDFPLLFKGAHPRYHGLVVELDGAPVGSVTYKIDGSTFRASEHYMYLEDLYLAPETRGKGLGKLVMSCLAEIAIRSGYKEIDFSYQHTNAEVESFYTSLGAEKDTAIHMSFSNGALVEMQDDIPLVKVSETENHYAGELPIAVK